ncbi:MAG: hypothetical protein KDB07_10805 [Planctomycetes bacterium]|nr:hypothetical protein [Planctomycetota bacterium]
MFAFIGIPDKYFNDLERSDEIVFSNLMSLLRAVKAGRLVAASESVRTLLQSIYKYCKSSSFTLAQTSIGIIEELMKAQVTLATQTHDFFVESLSLSAPPMDTLLAHADATEYAIEARPIEQFQDSRAAILSDKLPDDAEACTDLDLFHDLLTRLCQYSPTIRIYDRFMLKGGLGSSIDTKKFQLGLQFILGTWREANLNLPTPIVAELYTLRPDASSKEVRKRWKEKLEKVLPNVVVDIFFCANSLDDGKKMHPRWIVSDRSALQIDGGVDIFSNVDTVTGNVSRWYDLIHANNTLGSAKLSGLRLAASPMRLNKRANDYLSCWKVV